MPGYKSLSHKQRSTVASSKPDESHPHYQEGYDQGSPGDIGTLKPKVSIHHAAGFLQGSKDSLSDARV